MVSKMGLDQPRAAVVTHGPFKVETAGFVCKFKLNGHGSEGVIPWMVEVLVVDELLRPFAQEVHALPTAQSVINQLDILKLVLLILTGLLLMCLSSAAEKLAFRTEWLERT
jgi:hypothetical protein